MTSPRSALSIIVVALGLMVSCNSAPEDDAAPAPPPADTIATAPLPVRPPEEGTYALRTVGGAPVPAAVGDQGACRVEVVAGTLRVEAGRFAFQNQTREICPGVSRDSVLHAAGGTYEIREGLLILRTDVGAAFSAARGTIDDAGIRLEQLATEAGAERVSWRFERSSPPR